MTVILANISGCLENGWSYCIGFKAVAKMEGMIDDRVISPLSIFWRQQPKLSTTWRGNPPHVLEGAGDSLFLDI